LRKIIFHQSGNEEKFSLAACLSLLTKFDFINDENFDLKIAMRILCYDLLREKCNDSIKLLSTIIENNPKLILNPNESILSLTIQTILKESQNENLSFHRDEIEMYKNIEDSFDWKSEPLNVSQLVDKMIDIVTQPKDIDPNELIANEDFELIKSIELISSLKGWKWTYKELLIGKFWKFIQKPKVPNDTRRNIIVLMLVGSLGKLGLEKGLTHENRAEIVMLRRRLLIVLSETGQLSFSILTQITAANSFVELSLKHENLKDLFQWFEKMNENQKLFPKKLTDVFNFFMDSKFTLPNSIQK
jgi:hypothetical protein